MEATTTKSTPIRMDVNVFLALWITAYILVYLLLYAIDRTYWTFINRAPDDTAIQLINMQEDWKLVGFMLMALLFGLILPVAQTTLIRRHFGIRIRQWVMMSVIGWLVGGFFAYYAESVRYPAFTMDGFVLSLLAFWMPAVLLQAMLLRRGVKQWWLWIVMNLIGVLLFAVTYWLIDGTQVLVLLRPIGFIPAAIIQGADCASALFQMFPQESSDKQNPVGA
jgi:hypothetical protein